MSTKEQELINEINFLQAEGYLVAHEADWCRGAIRMRHGLTSETRHALRDSVKHYIDQAFERYSNLPE